MSDDTDRIWIEDERPIGGDLHVFTTPPVKGAEEYVVEYTRTDLVRAQIKELEAKLATLEDAARSALEYVEHKESEWGVNLAMGNKLRAALASLQGDKT